MEITTLSGCHKPPGAAPPRPVREGEAEPPDLARALLAAVRRAIVASWLSPGSRP